MRAKHFNNLHGTSFILSSVALILSLISMFIYGDQKSWTYLFLSTLSTALQLYSIWKVFIWSLHVWDDEDEIEFDRSSIPYIIVIVLSNISSIYLFVHALKVAN